MLCSVMFITKNINHNGRFIETIYHGNRKKLIASISYLIDIIPIKMTNKTYTIQI